MPELGSGNQQIRVDIAVVVDRAQQAVDRLKEIQKLLATIRTVSGTPSIATKQIEQVNAQAKSFKQLGFEADVAARKIRAGGNSVRVGIRGLSSDVSKHTSEQKKLFKNYKEEMDRVGTPIVGLPRDMAALKNNQRTLKENLSNTKRAGIANAAVLNGIATGAEAVGGRGLTAFERMRVRAFALNKDLQSVGFNMTKLAKDAMWTGRQMFMGISAPLGALTLLASQEFLKVQKEMFQLRKVTEFKDIERAGVDGKEAASGVEFYAKLEKQIKTLAIEFGKSQSQIAAVFKDIAALGVPDELIEGWGKAITELSAIGDVDTQTASEFFRVTNALFSSKNQMGESVVGGEAQLERTNEIMQSFNAIADETSLQLKDLADAFPEVAPVMQQMGFSANVIASSLAGMYRRGIPATEGAHALKFAFQRLVGPTKDAQKIIDQLNISFFDASGAASDGRKNVMAMASALLALPEAERGAAFGDLFGNRQVARLVSFAKDVELGERQITKAFEDGVFSKEDLDQITSDYARGLAASGELANDIKKSGRQDLKVELDDPMSRYTLAIEQFKKDPSTQWQGMITQWKINLAEIGAIFVPIISEWGKKLQELLSVITSMPPPFLKMVGVLGLMAAAVGPLLMAFASFKMIGGQALTIFGKLIPKMNIKDLVPEQAAKLLRENPKRDDIGFLGSRVFQIADKEKVPKKFAEAPRITKLKQLSSILGISDDDVTPTNKGLKKFKNNLSSSLKDLANLQAAGPKGMQAIADATDRASKAVANFEWHAGAAGKSAKIAAQRAADGLDAAFDLAAADEAVIAAKNVGQQAADIILEENRNAEEIIYREKRKFADRSRLFGSADGKKSGIAQGMLFSRYWGVSAEKGIRARMKRLAKIAMVPINPVGIFRAGKEGVKDVAAGGRESRRVFTKGMKSITPDMSFMDKFKTVFTTGFKSIKTFLVPLTLAFSKFILVAGLVAGALAAIGVVAYAAFKTVIENWDKIYARIKPTLDILVLAFRQTWEAVQQLVSVFKNAVGSTIFKDWADNADNAAQSGVGWRSFADVLEKVLVILTGIVNKINEALRSETFKKVVEFFGQYVGGIIGFFIKLIKAFKNGDWESALRYLLFTTIKYLTPLTTVFQFIFRKILELMQKFLSTIGNAIPFYLQPIFGGALDGMNNAFQKVIDYDLVGEVNKWADEMLEPYKELIGDFGSPGLEPRLKTDWEEESVEAMDGLGDAAEDASDKVGKLKDALVDFLSILKEKVRDQMNELREALLLSIDNAHESKISSLDKQIEAINNAKKAEEELLEKQQLIERKRELLYKRSLDIQDYQRNRALAIYEGRIADVRTMDLGFEQSTRDFNKSRLEIEMEQSDISKNKVRDAEILRLENLKKIEEDIYKIRKEGFEKQLDLIMQYEPRTVGEFDAMISQMQFLANRFSVTWPQTAKTGGEYFLIALDATNQEIIKTFGWAGEAGIMEWVRAFISSEAWAILLYKATEAAGGVGSSMGSAMASGMQDAFNDGIEQMTAAEEAAKIAGDATKGIKGMPDAFDVWASLPLDSAVSKNVLGLWGNQEDAAERRLQEIDPNSNTAKYARFRQARDWQALGGGGPLTYGQWQAAQPAGPMNRLPTDPLGPMASTGAKSTKLVGDTLRQAGSAIGDMLQRKMAQHGQNVSNAFVGGVQSRSPFLQQQTKSLFTNNVIAPTKQVFLIQSPSKVFQGFGIDIVDGLILGLSLGNIAGRMIDIIGFAIRSTVGAGPMMISSLVGFFMSIPGKLIDALRWGFSTAGGKVIEFGKEILKTLARFLEDSVFSNVRDFSIFGVRPFEKLPNLKELVEKYHSGGIVGQSGGISAGPIKADEVNAILQKGEGVLPVSAMNKIGPKAFEMLRRGMIGDVLAMSMQGQVKAMSPRIPSVLSGANRGTTMAKSDGNIYINVDTFIGEEEWFNQLAAQYDMKVSARRAKANGSQSRVISSYNSNERNTYR